MTDFYSDTDKRMRDDAAFASAVQYMMAMAQQHGFTPGELKQIAFRAALELEMRRLPGPVFRTGQQPDYACTCVTGPVPCRARTHIR